MAYIQRIMGRKLPIMVILDQNIKTQNINDTDKKFSSLRCERKFDFKLFSVFISLKIWIGVEIQNTVINFTSHLPFSRRSVCWEISTIPDLEPEYCLQIRLYFVNETFSGIIDTS